MFRANGIRSLSDLKAYAKRTYDEVFPADAVITDPTDRRHSLNRFMAYHILPFAMDYNASCYYFPHPNWPRWDMTTCFDRTHEDISEWYATYLPGCLIKISCPAYLDGKLYANRRGVANHADWYGQFIPGVRFTNPADAPKADNGIVFQLDSVLTYDLRTVNIVHNDRVRMSCSTLSTDFLASGARNVLYQFSGLMGPNTQAYKCYAFKASAADGFTFDDSGTQLFVRCRFFDGWDFQGSSIFMLGNGDVSIQLPVLPAGEWELRMGLCDYCFSDPVQCYLDEVPCGEPVSQATMQALDWKSDEELDDAEAMLAFDRAFHEAGWMKGCASYLIIGKMTMRSLHYLKRRVLGRIVSDGHTPHTLRLSPRAESDQNSIMSFDFLEFCPRSIYDGDKPEDNWIYEQEQ